MRIVWASLKGRVSLPSMLAVLASTVALWRIAGRLFPSDAQWVGQDYSYFFPYLVSGTGWVKAHGWLSPPYFTPDFCGGLPWLANPQSLFYSAPQWLAVHTDPVNAVRWTLIVFATVGAAATWLLLRRCFVRSAGAATLGFVLFQLNGFLIFRLAVGHLPFHVLGLAPVLALLVLWPAAARRHHAALTAAAGLCLAAMVFAGAAVLIAPIVASVAVVIALCQVDRGATREPWFRLGAASVLGVLISAIKLVPALVLVGRFPRHESTALIPAASTYLSQLARSLFAAESLPPFIAIGTGQPALNQHELEFGVTVVPLVLLFALLIRWLRKPRRPQHLGPAAALSALAIVATCLSAGTPGWAGLLHHLPIIGSNSVGARWWIVWTIGFIVAAPLAFDALATHERARTLLLATCCLLVLGQNSLRDFSRYTQPTTFSVYDPAAAAQASASIRGGAMQVAISAIAAPVPVHTGDGVTPWIANDGTFEGHSALPCYEPLFGHDFQLFPPTRLVAGPALMTTADGAINLADPRCYLDGGSNNCQPGSRFSVADSMIARRFAAHDGIDWQEPAWFRWSRFASVLFTCLSLLVMLLALRTTRPR